MKVQNDVPLAQFTSLRAGGIAQKLIILDETDDLAAAVSSATGSGRVWVLGFGTNCLISDKGLGGTVIINQHGKIEQFGPTRLKVDSGALWDEVVEHAVSNQLWGIEFSSGIPGGTGAAVAGNIAAYGHKIADHFVEATLLDTRDGSIAVWDNPQMGFDYRTSALQLPENKHLVVLNATFELSTQSTGELEYESALQTAQALGISPDSLANRRKIILETRSRVGSLMSEAESGPRTAGSFFKNPVVDETQVQAIIDHEETSISREQLVRQNLIHGQNKARVSAAHVLLAAGFHRGQSWGKVGLHPDHILKVQNLGGATAQEIYEVIQHILETVKSKLNISLEPEVQFLGEFK